MKTTIYVLECSRTEHEHAKWHSLSAYDNIDDAVERMKYFKRTDNENGDSDEYQYGIREVTLYHT